MRTYLFPEETKSLIAQADEIIEKNKDSEYLKRVLAVQFALRGVPKSTIATCFDVTERSVQKWYSNAIKEGYPVLQRKWRSGRPAKLTAWQIKYIEEWLEDDGPFWIDPNAKVWTGKLLSQAILRHFDISISPKWCSNFISEYKSRFSLNSDYLYKHYRISR